MKDLINRQAALREYQSVCYGINCGACPFLTEDEDKLCKLELWIHGLPSAQPEPLWIPCSERLPEEPFGCLVTVWDTNLVTMDDFENILPYFVGWDGEQWNDGDGEQCPFEVIAWMPLPEPYQGGEQE